MSPPVIGSLCPVQTCCPLCMAQQWQSLSAWYQVSLLCFHLNSSTLQGLCTYFATPHPILLSFVYVCIYHLYIKQMPHLFHFISTSVLSPAILLFTTLSF